MEPSWFFVIAWISVLALKTMVSGSLELVVVILIDHRDSEISVGRQTLGACQSSETRTHDYDALCSDFVNLHS